VVAPKFLVLFKDVEATETVLKQAELLAEELMS
jgi:hypothetical protein